MVPLCHSLSGIQRLVLPGAGAVAFIQNVPAFELLGALDEIYDAALEEALPMD